MRINDEITQKLKIVSSISGFLEDLEILNSEWNDDNSFFVYRGECQEYDTPCIPSIFRNYLLSENPNYELNMFMAMRQNSISDSASMLHNAIDAQHDGFPSRLLDVTYNSLIALYFAVTPYYYKNENEFDNKDGIVYFFKFDEAYSPEALNTKKIYDDAIKGNTLINNCQFLSHHHILIDHCKQNKRIIAQQGAFILFTGEKPIPIPYYKMCGIRILGKAKSRIRKELKNLFGIYTGSVYPEVELMNEEILDRSKRLNTYFFDIERATNSVIVDFQKEYDYFSDCCDFYIRFYKNRTGKKEKNEGIQVKGELYRLIEKTIVTHKEHIKTYYKMLYNYYNNISDFKGNSDDVIKEIEKVLIKPYNDTLNDFKNNLSDDIAGKFDDNIFKNMEVV